MGRLLFFGLNRSRNVGAAIVAALWFTYFVNYLDRVSINFAAPIIMRELTLTHTGFGLVLSAFATGYFLSQVPGGLLADRWGARRLLIVGPILWSACTALSCLSSTAGELAAVRFGLGFSEGLTIASVFKLIGDNFDSTKRPLAIAVIITAPVLAPVIAGPLVGSLIAAFGWRTTLGVLILPTAAATLANYAFLPGETGDKRLDPTDLKRSGSNYALILKRPALWLLCAGSFCWNIAFWGYLSWVPTFLSETQGLDIKSLGALSSIPFAFSFAGLLACGWAADRLPLRRSSLVTMCYIVAALFLSGAIIAHGLLLTLTMLSGAAFFLLGPQGVSNALVLDLAPEDRRASFASVVQTATQFGGVVAPVAMGGLISATGGFVAAFSLLVGALLVAAASYAGVCAPRS